MTNSRRTWYQGRVPGRGPTVEKHCRTKHRNVLCGRNVSLWIL